MRKAPPAADPDAYVAALEDWQGPLVSALRAAAQGAAAFDEKIKWGHLVYFANGPALLIRAEESRVILGFWRGKRLTGLESRLETGGKYEMGRIVLRAGEAIARERIAALAREAHRLNHEVGDPTART